MPCLLLVNNRIFLIVLIKNFHGDSNQGKTVELRTRRRCAICLRCQSARGGEPGTDQKQQSVRRKMKIEIHEAVQQDTRTCRQSTPVKRPSPRTPRGTQVSVPKPE